MSSRLTGSPRRVGSASPSCPRNLEGSKLQAPSSGGNVRRPLTEDEPLAPAGDGIGQPLPDRVLVYARCRPFLADAAVNASPIPTPSSPSTRVPPKLELLAIPESHKVSIRGSDDIRSPTAREFKFDGVFDGPSEQADVYTTVARPVLREALCGYHGCIMAYGQTGSGKTHTLLNTGAKNDLSQAGLVPRLAADLFIQTAADAFAKYEVSVGMVQIYNEQVDDLLAQDNHGLKIKQDTTSKGGGWVVEGMSWRAVDSAAKLLESVTEARKRLVYAETKMNKHSSRSHCVMSLRIVRQEVPAGLISKDGKVDTSSKASVHVRQTEGKLTIVDLAGSERIKKSAAQDQRLKEAININTSLLMLGNVIQSLAARQSHVPFRDSALTRLLESSLGGNSRCAMIVCIAPEPAHISESASTLEFASRAMRVETRPVLHESTVEVDPSELASNLSSQFESDVAVRSQVEVMHLKHALAEQAARTEEGARVARTVNAQLAGLKKALAEESAKREAAEAEARDAQRKLSAKEAALRKAMSAQEASQETNVKLERSLADAKAAAAAASASTAAARDQARTARETSSALQTQLEVAVQRRHEAESALNEFMAKEERQLQRRRTISAQTDPVVFESDDEDELLANGRLGSSRSLSSGRFFSARASMSDFPSSRPSSKKQELIELQAVLREKVSKISQLERDLANAAAEQQALKKTRDELEDALFQERAERCEVAAGTEAKVEAKVHEYEASMLRMGLVCTKRGRNGKEYTRVIRLSEDLSTLEWAAVQKFKPGMQVQGVEEGVDSFKRPLTTIKGYTRSTSIVPHGRLQEQWAKALVQHFSGSSESKDGSPSGRRDAALAVFGAKTGMSPNGINSIKVITDPERRESLMP